MKAAYETKIPKNAVYVCGALGLKIMMTKNCACVDSSLSFYTAIELLRVKSVSPVI